MGGVLRKSSHLQVREVKYGFKAPVAMVFVPLWAHLLPRFKFLHVVRDGRDIAFSANQGPVDKFFMDMYQSTGDINLNMPMPVKGIKLWSDWNSEIQNWSSKTFQRQLEVESRSTYLNTSDTLRHNISKQFSKYDYFVLHSENLVHESVSTRFITLYRLAQWLGSNASMNDICCLAHDDSEFLGSHDRTDPNQVNDRQLKKRYGKWRQFPDKNILAQLHSVGQNGLQLFGYEQTTNTTYSSTTASATANTPHNDGSNMLKLDSLPIQSLLFRRSKHTRAHEKSGEYDCAIKPHICPVDVFASAQPAVHPAEAYAAQNKCQIQIGTDYKSQDISTLTVVKTKPEDCCLACVTTPGCHYFTLNVRNSMCYLKGEKGQIITNDSTLLLVSGILR